MLIRYECPKASHTGAYAILNTETREGTGYYADGAVRWYPRYISEKSEAADVACGTWVNAGMQLPEGF